MHTRQHIVLIMKEDQVEGQEQLELCYCWNIYIFFFTFADTLGV